MTVYWNKARQRWSYDFEQDGQRYSGYCIDPESKLPAQTKTQAKAIEDLLKVAARRQARDALRIPGVMTLATALAAHAERHKGKRHFENVAAYIRELLGYFGPDTPVTAIDESWCWKYIRWAQEQTVMVYVAGPRKKGAIRVTQPLGGRPQWKPSKDGRKRSDSTINRYLDCLRAGLRMASRARNPLTGESYLPHPPIVPELKVPKRIPRPVREGDLQDIVAIAARHLACVVVLSNLMGFRRSEALLLTVDHVDEDRRGVLLRGEETKSGDDEFIPANEPAMVLLLKLKAEAEATGVKHLITYARGRDGEPAPLKSIKSAWRRVMRELGLKHRFHDVRASFITALAERVPAGVVQALARHQDPNTTQAYVNVVDDARRAGVDALAGRASVVGLDLTQDLGRAPSPRQKSQTGLRVVEKKKLSA